MAFEASVSVSLKSTSSVSGETGLYPQRFQCDVVYPPFMQFAGSSQRYSFMLKALEREVARCYLSDRYSIEMNLFALHWMHKWLDKAVELVDKRRERLL